MVATATEVSPWLDFLWLEITGKCNLACTHCYADSSPFGSLSGNMAPRNWLQLIDEAAHLGCRDIQFIGGEPTLHPHLHEFISHAKACGFTLIEVFTNATRLGSAMINCFRANHVSVATSFYSDDPVVHDRITTQNGSWKRTVSGIKELISADIPLRVGLVEMEHNAERIPQATEFLRSLGISRLKVDRRRGVGRSDALPQESEGERFDELCGECWKGKLCVTQTGDVFPCVFSRATRIGNAKSGLRNLLSNETLSNFRRTVRDYRKTKSGAYAQCPPCNPCEPVYCTPGNGCDPQTDPCQPTGSSCGPL